MWRGLALAFALTCGTSAAFACEDPYSIDGIIYGDLPADTPASALVLDVAFDDEAPSGPLVARVRRVVQGDYTEPTIRVGVINSSCLYPFIFGRAGLIIGELRQGAITHTFGTGDRQIVLREGFDGTWFRPKLESVAERRERTGIDPFVRHLSPLDGAPSISGDFDGVGARDSAAFYTDEDGNLVIAVNHGNSDDMPIIWTGDMASLPYFTFRTTGPGTYQNLCHLYGSDCGGAPREVTTSHDAIIVTALEGPAEFLYYWEDGEFKDIIINE